LTRKALKLYKRIFNLYLERKTQAPKNRYEVWHLECYEPLLDRLSDGSSEGLGKYKLELFGVQEVRWEKGGTERAEDYTFFYGEGNGDHQLGTGFFLT
jgi:hypothetical protein